MDRQELSQEDIMKVAAELDVLSNMFGPEGTGKTMKLASDYLMLLSAYVFSDDDKFREVKQDDIDMVNQPPHYKIHKMECIDEMREVFGDDVVKAYCKCAAWKYRYRAPYKGKFEQDNEKADWYIAELKEIQDVERYLQGQSSD